ncbi:hypothetical protein MPER_09093, partial [Moniliophthora perniciosa FA553]
MSIHGPSQSLPEHRASHRMAQYSKTIVHHMQKHVGVGIICAVAYFDPGNWSVDLQAGSDFGYRPMLMSFALIEVSLQTLAIRLGYLAELLGSAIGLCLIFPRLPLYASVILTAVDVLVFLLFADPSRGNGRPVKVFELVIIGLSQPNAIYAATQD